MQIGIHEHIPGKPAVGISIPAGHQHVAQSIPEDKPRGQGINLRVSAYAQGWGIGRGGIAVNLGIKLAQAVGFDIRQRKMGLNNMVHAVQPKGITIYGRITAGEFEIGIRSGVKNSLVERFVVLHAVISRIASAHFGGQVQESHDFLGNGNLMEGVEPAVAVRHQHSGPVIIGRSSGVHPVQHVPDFRPHERRNVLLEESEAGAAFIHDGGTEYGGLDTLITELRPLVRYVEIIGDKTLQQ